jgi:hypothetical protein
MSLHASLITKKKPIFGIMVGSMTSSQLALEDFDRWIGKLTTLIHELTFATSTHGNSVGAAAGKEREQVAQLKISPLAYL